LNSLICLFQAFLSHTHAHTHTPSLCDYSLQGPQKLELEKENEERTI
jgi:hypothetical protein